MSTLHATSISPENKENVQKVCKCDEYDTIYCIIKENASKVYESMPTKKKVLWWCFDNTGKNVCKVQNYKKVMQTFPELPFVSLLINR